MLSSVIYAGFFKMPNKNTYYLLYMAMKKKSLLPVYQRNIAAKHSIANKNHVMRNRNNSVPIYGFPHFYFIPFSNYRFWWIYPFWGPLNPKITFSVVGLCLCLCACLCVSVSLCICCLHNSKPNYSRIFNFNILHLYHI